MTTNRIDWYAGTVTRHGSNGVSIERGGQIAIGNSFMEDWPQNKAFARIGYVSRSRQIVIEPTAAQSMGCLKVQTPTKGKRATRIAAAYALRKWGITCERLMACGAFWRDGLLWVTLPGAGKEDSTTEVTESTETPEKEESANASTLQRSNAPTQQEISHAEPQGRREDEEAGRGSRAFDGDPTDPVDRVDGKPAQTDDRPPRCCRNCTWQKFRLCTNQGCEEHRNKNVSLDGVCDQHFYVLHLRRAGETDPRPERPHTTLTPAQREASRCVPQTGRAQQSPAKPGRRPATGQMGSRPRGLCSVSDHGGKDFPISGRGIGKHDVAGRHCTSIDYDKNNICPGSNKPPRD